VGSHAERKQTILTHEDRTVSAWKVTFKETADDLDALGKVRDVDYRLWVVKTRPMREANQQRQALKISLSNPPR
jgi:hypothetical protein